MQTSVPYWQEVGSTLSRLVCKAQAGCTQSAGTGDEAMQLHRLNVGVGRARRIRAEETVTVHDMIKLLKRRRQSRIVHGTVAKPNTYASSGSLPSRPPRSARAAEWQERRFHQSHLHDDGDGVVAQTGARLDDNVNAKIQDKSDSANQQ